MCILRQARPKGTRGGAQQGVGGRGHMSSELPDVLWRTARAGHHRRRRPAGAARPAPTLLPARTTAPVQVAGNLSQRLWSSGQGARQACCPRRRWPAAPGRAAPGRGGLGPGAGAQRVMHALQITSKAADRATGSAKEAPRPMVSCWLCPCYSTPPALPAHPRVPVTQSPRSLRCLRAAACWRPACVAPACAEPPPPPPARAAACIRGPR